MGLKKSRTNSYIAPTCTFPPPIFRYHPTDHGFHFCGIPKNLLRVNLPPSLPSASSLLLPLVFIEKNN